MIAFQEHGLEVVRQTIAEHLDDAAAIWPPVHIVAEKDERLARVRLRMRRILLDQMQQLE